MTPLMWAIFMIMLTVIIALVIVVMTNAVDQNALDSCRYDKCVLRCKFQHSENLIDSLSECTNRCVE